MPKFSKDQCTDSWKIWVLVLVLLGITCVIWPNWLPSFSGFSLLICEMGWGVRQLRCCLAWTLRDSTTILGCLHAKTALNSTVLPEGSLGRVGKEADVSQDRSPGPKATNWGGVSCLCFPFPMPEARISVTQPSVLIPYPQTRTPWPQADIRGE